MNTKKLLDLQFNVKTSVPRLNLKVSMKYKYVFYLYFSDKLSLC